MPIFLKLFKKKKLEETLPISYTASVTLIPKSDIDTPRKENYRILLMKIDEKINKILGDYNE